MQKIAIVDLDDTLFDIKKFKKEYFGFLQKLGYSESTLDFTYQRAKERGYYDTDAHCKDLGMLLGVETHIFQKIIQKYFLENDNLLEQFVFSDTELFLRLLGHHGYKVYILTLGTNWFQRAKIEGAGLLEFIFQYVVTRDPKKVNAIPLFCDPMADEVVLFDDSWKVIDAVKQSFPKVLAIQVLREHDFAKQAARADALARNLEEAMGAVLARQTLT